MFPQAQPRMPQASRTEFLLTSSGASAPRYVLLTRGVSPPLFFVDNYILLTAILEPRLTQTAQGSGRIPQ